MNDLHYTNKVKQAAPGRGAFRPGLQISEWQGVVANIYEDKSEALHVLLERAGLGKDATVLIPDLQRPYVWNPLQVTLRVDSLIRGWPFGTLLMWKVAKDALSSIPHRPFWYVADRTGI